MGQILHGAQTDGTGLVLGVMSVVFFVLFVVAAIWGIAGYSRSELQTAANLPFDDET